MGRAPAVHIDSAVISEYDGERRKRRKTSERGTHMKYEGLNRKISEMQEEILASVRESIQIRSVKGEPAPEAPYGEGPKRALEHALELGRKLGFRTGSMDHRVGWIEYGEGEEMAAVLGHLDVVPEGGGWTYPPFGGEIHDGKMYGRGVLDDKGPVIGAIYGLKAIRDAGLKLDRRLRVIFGTDEENGSSCVKYYIQNGGELPAIGFTPDADYPLIFCEKGQLFWKLTRPAKAGKTAEGNVPAAKLIRLEGGTAKNVVMPECVLEVEGKLKVKSGEGITVTEENGRTTVTAVGKGAHGSTPELGINAAQKLFAAIEDSDLEEGLRQMVRFVLDKIGTETNGASLGICYQDEETGETTVNLGTARGTEEELSLTLDIRYPKNGDREEMIRNVKACAAEYGFQAEVEAEGRLLYLPKDSELVQKLMKVYREQTGTEAEPMAIGGGTYAKNFENMAAFGPVFPGDAALIHQPDECAEVEKLVKSWQITAAAMYEIARKQDEGDQV